MEIYPVLMVASAAVLGAFAQLELKRGADSIQFTLYSLFTNWHLIGGVALYGVATLIYVLALTRGDLSVLYPVIATSYIWTAFLSIYFLGEKMAPVNWFGILLIILGIGLVIR